jgi:hypothetical protein
MGRLRLRVTLALALLLMVGGVIAAIGASLLQQALRIPTADDIAQRVCTAYQRQDYDLLLAQIDPAPIPPAVPGPFDAAARNALEDQLRALDAAAGAVTHCSYKELTGGARQPADQRHYFYSMQRHVLYTMAMSLTSQPDGSWKLTRDSDFIGGPANASALTTREMAGSPTISAPVAGSLSTAARAFASFAAVR